MSKWRAFRTEAKGQRFTQALTAFKAAVPSTSRRWDSEHGYWLFNPSFADAVEAIPTALVRAAVGLAEDDRRFGCVSVREDEELDTALVDLQHGDPATRQEFERRLR